MPRVFISHSTQDRTFVEQEIVRLLAEHGIETWYAADSIQTADRWERSIFEGLQACDWFLIVLSPHSAASGCVKDELAWAIEKRPGRLIPVLLRTARHRPAARYHARDPDASGIVRTSSMGWRGRRKPSSACWKGTTSASSSSE